MSETQTSVLSPADLTSAVLGLQQSINTRDTRFDRIDGRLERIQDRLVVLEAGQRRIEGNQATIRREMHEDIGDLRVKMKVEFTEAGEQFAITDRAVHGQLQQLRSEMTDGFGAMQAAMDTRFTKVRQEIAEVRQEMDTRFTEIDRRFSEVDQRFGDVDRRFDGMEAQMRAIAEAVGAPIVEAPAERRN
jgi:hypothetical protein